MTAGSPQVAVVIPTTTGRETRLAFALEALAGQTLDRGRFEVLVVCAFDRTRGSLIEVPSGLSVRLPAAWGEDTDLGLRATELGAELRYVDGALVWHAVVPRPLPVALKDTRRRGSTAAVVARHPVHRGELYGRLFAHERHAKLLLGPTEPDPDERPLLAGLARTINNPRPSGWCETCNIAYPRELLEAVGGFDESIAFLGEDTDLAMRATKSGADVRFVVGALVWHAVDPRNLGTALRDVVRRSSRPAIVARHRELRASLWRGVFTDRDHARLLLALAGMLAARRAPALCALACAPYVKHHLGVAPLTPWRAVRVPFRLLSFAILDAAETLAFAASSVRHRVLVL